ncbi:histidine kinase [Flavobacterium sp. 270]|uniref:sensor histidine kinase n=1 Tax=Flavobacterium sp. 270 TaxID=2512114 RepID=UPI0010668266|nr:histidine kinase [Flavobacterium sp. 270]TDW51720.1 histidine kinase [Flavobacterium sp. 270]
MKKKIPLFTIVFLLFYGVAILARQLPGLIHGRFFLAEESHTLKEWIQVSGDLIIYYLLAFSVYVFCCIYHPAKRYFLLVGLVFSAYVASFFLGLFWVRFTEGFPVRMSQYFRVSFFMFVAQIAFATLFYLIRYLQYKEVQQLALQLQHQQTELSFLRSQINPHFLFNNLNNIYAMVYEENTQALPAIAEFSELIRYMLYEGNDKVTLEKELEYLDKFISLQQLRFQYPSSISVDKNSNANDSLIPPFLLIPFVENAFKHGQVNTAENWLKIVINNTKDRLYFSCANKIGTKRKDEGGGIGLENVKQRLALLYPDKHQLEIEHENNWFIVNLQLQHGK